MSETTFFFIKATVCIKTLIFTDISWGLLMWTFHRGGNAVDEISLTVYWA